MQIFKAGSCLLWFVLIPFAVGMNAAGSPEERASGWKKALIHGYLILFGVFELLAVPLTFLRRPFHVLVWLFAGSSLLLGIAGLIRKRACLARWRKSLSLPRIRICGALALLVILLQTGVAVFCWHSDADDSTFIATANTTVATDTIYQIEGDTGEPYAAFPARYVLAPYQIWIAFLARMTGFHPATMGHTVLPLMLIPLAYVLYSLLGELFFPDDADRQDIFLLVTAVIQMSSYYSVFTSGTFLLVRIWQGKAVLASILLPAVFWLCIRLMVEKEKKGWLLLAFAMLACLMVSSMGIMLPVLVTAGFAFLYGLLRKDWRALLRSILVCLPNLCFAIFYLVLKG